MKPLITYLFPIILLSTSPLLMLSDLKVTLDGVFDDWRLDLLTTYIRNYKSL
jgi:hypothetical protein